MGSLSQLVGQPGQPLQDASVDNFINAAAGRPSVVGESAVLKPGRFSLPRCVRVLRRRMKLLARSVLQNVHRGCKHCKVH